MTDEDNGDPHQADLDFMREVREGTDRYLELLLCMEVSLWRREHIRREQRRRTPPAVAKKGKDA